MGVKLIILLALLLGILYCIHLLVKDYQAVTAPRLLRLLFKRELDSRYHQHQQQKPHVRWKKILGHDRAQCARLLYCGLAAAGDGEVEVEGGEVRRGLAAMLSLEPTDEDRSAMQEFRAAYELGARRRAQEAKDPHACSRHYPLCPFGTSTLFGFVDLLLKHQIF